MPKKHKNYSTKKRRGGGSGLLAHPYKGTYSPNPVLAYNKMYPATQPRGSFDFLNPLNAQFGGHSGSSYPNGLVGTAYNNPNNLPGVNGIGGNANYYKYNTDPTLQTRSLINVGANRPFLKGGKYPLKGGCEYGTCLRGGRRSLKRSKSKRKKLKGGFTSSNTLGQEFINLGKSVPFTLNSAYNGLFGYPPPVNPSPLVGQLARPIHRI